jgi:hypothetical protein
MSEPIDHARAWQRPVFSAAVIGGILACLWKLPPEHALDALRAFLWAGAALYMIRGVVDKGWIERVVAIWRGQAPAA